jgi:beta-lactam-binding protein with PASTA domain
MQITNFAKNITLKMANFQLLDNFKAKHPVLFHSILAFIVFLAGIYTCLLLTDVFTNHGEQVKVPDVSFLPLQQAIDKLEAAGLEYEVDSIYNEDYKPGIVIDQVPVANSMIKAIRPVLLTINMVNPPKVQLPLELTDMAGSDGITTLKSLGFRNVTTDTVPSDKAGLIISVSVNNRQVMPGTKAPLNAHINLTIGDGSMDIMEYDPLSDIDRDSLIQDQIKRGLIQIEDDSDE